MLQVGQQRNRLVSTVYALLLTGAVLWPADASALGNNGQASRPFYIVGHNPNTFAEVIFDLAYGANALEPDVMRFSNSAKYYADRTINSEADDSGLFIYHDSVEVTTRMPDTLEAYLDYVRALVVGGQNVALITFDIKSPAATKQYGKALQDAVWSHLNHDGVNVNVIYSVGTQDDVAVFEDILPRLKAREGVMIDGENNPVTIVNYFLDAIYAINATRTSDFVPYNIGFGNGSIGESFGLAPNVLLSMDQASWIRVGQGISFAIPYAFPIEGIARMNEYIVAGVDGLIPDVDAPIVNPTNTRAQIAALKLLVDSNPDVYVATAADNPFQPSLQGYALRVATLNVGGAGTDSRLTFTLKGCGGTASVTYDSSYEGRFEQNNVNYVTIPSKNLGTLQSLTLSKDNAGNGPDWDPGKIEISSARYGIPYSSHISVTFTDTVSDDTPRTKNFPANVGEACACDTQPPVLTCPGSRTLECTGGQAASTSYVPTVTDNCSLAALPSCSPTSGSSFSLGSQSVTCSVSDVAGNGAQCSFDVTVADTTAPAIQCDSSQTLECTKPTGAVASYGATSSDVCWGTLAASCSPISGSTFGLGTTTVDCSATDGSSHTSSCNMDITVRDTTKPVLALEGVVAPIECGVDTFTDPGARVVTEVCDADLLNSIVIGTQAVDPATVGDYIVSYDAADASGNKALPITRLVSVVDRLAPQIRCPEDITVQPVAPEGRRVSFAAEQWSDECDQHLPTPSCPASGNWFGVGSQTEVSCEVTDATGGHSSTCSLTVTVLTEDEVVRTVRDELEVLLSAGRISQSLARKLNRRLWKIQAAIARGRLSTLCRQLDRWTAYVQRRLSASLTSEELARLLDPVANVRSTVACPQ